jgi:hypothetical protein
MIALPSALANPAPGNSLPTDKLRSVGTSEQLEITMNAMARDFLMFPGAPDSSIEARAYLIKCILPTLMMALEKLLMEVESREAHAEEDFRQIGGLNISN